VLVTEQVAMFAVISLIFGLSFDEAFFSTFVYYRIPTVSFRELGVAITTLTFSLPELYFSHQRIS
jgi:hypothetical protein